MLIDKKKIIFEEMTAKHIEDLVLIEKASFSKPWTYKGFEAELTNDTAYFLTAVYEGKAIGYIGLHTILDEGYIANIAVLPQYRRNGIGEMLLREIINYSNKKNLCFITLEVRKSNVAAIALYRKFGFETVGERKNFYSAPQEDGLIMTLQFDKK